MKIICCVETAWPADAPLHFEREQIDATPALNPLDEMAIEEALRIRERTGGRIDVLAICDASGEAVLRHTLALGVDAAIRIEPDAAQLDSSSEACLIAEEARRREFDLILCGTRSVDRQTSARPVMIAERLGLPFLGPATALDIGASSISATVPRDGCSAVYRAKIPAVVTADRSLNTPRLPKLKQVLAARRQTISVQPASPGSSIRPTVERIKIASAPQRKAAGSEVTGTPDEMAEKLAAIIAKARG